MKLHLLMMRLVALQKIKSIDNTKSLYELEQNSWGIRMPNSSKYDPIPSASSARVFTENNWQYELSIGIRVGDNLESGRYSNKLIFSMISNPYELIAETTSGYKFNDIMKSFDTIEEGYYAKKERISNTLKDRMFCHQH